MLTVRKSGHRLGWHFAARRDARREQPVSDDSSQTEPIVDASPSPAEAALLADTVAALVEGLGEHDLPIVLLRLAGRSTREISAEARCTERTVHRVLDRVRKGLQRLAVEWAARHAPVARAPGWSNSRRAAPLLPITSPFVPSLASAPAATPP